MTDTPTRLTAEREAEIRRCAWPGPRTVNAMLYELLAELDFQRARAEAAEREQERFAYRANQRAEAAERRLAEVREVTAAAYSDVRQRRPADDILNDIHAMVNAEPQP